MAKKLLLLAALGTLLGLNASPAEARRTCGQSYIAAELIRNQPQAFAQMRQDQQSKLADFLHIGAAQKTAAYDPIPVVFHFVLTTAQWNVVGKDTGILRRVISQLAVLNEDYNRGNADSVLIPSAFKPLYTRVGIRFGLANTTSGATIYPGIELKIVPTGTVYDINDLGYKAKQNTAYGLPQWDKNKYLNVWVCNISASGQGQILGVTTPPSLVGVPLGARTIGDDELGVILNYGAIGREEFENQYFIEGINKGRTLTHEIGHYFELIHTWGDDESYGTGINCPGDMSGSTQIGWDDEISDTPPEAVAATCTNSICPTFPKLDKCSPASPGIMFMNYMDYVDDKAMQMFTIKQSERMNAFLALQSISLVQHPELVYYPALGLEEQAAGKGSFTLAPNPATGIVRLHVTTPTGLKSVEIVDMLGKSILKMAATSGKADYEINLSDAARGVYFVRCFYNGGVTSQKLILE